MARRRRYRHRRKTTPLQELAFLGVLVVVGSLPILQQTVFDKALYVVCMLGIFGVCVGTVLFFLSYLKSQRSREALFALQLADVDRMNPLDFEDYIAELLSAQGYQADTTRFGGDFGLDVIATKGGIRLGVQVKHKSLGKGSVGVKAVYEAAGGKPHYHCDRIMVVTNGVYTKQAIEIAKSHNCTLIDRDQLAEWILILQTQLVPEM
jgi:restriction system protein